MKKYNSAFVMSVVLTALFAYMALSNPAVIIGHIGSVLNLFPGTSYAAAAFAYNLILDILSPLCISLTGCLGAKSAKTGVLRCLVVITLIEIFRYAVQGTFSPIKVLIAYGVALLTCRLALKTKNQCKPVR